MIPEPHESALRDWVVLGTGLPDDRVIFAGQSAAPPRPDLVYATVLVLSETHRDPVTSMSDTPLGAGYEFDVTTHVSGTVSVQVFGDGSRATIASLSSSLKRPDVQILLSERGVWPTLAGSGGIIDTQAALSTSFEQRAAQDFRFTFTRSFVTEAGAITEVAINGAVN